MINLTEKLKNVPEGTKMYSPLFQEPVEFVKINEGTPYPIVCKTSVGELFVLTQEGYYTKETAPQNCMLFPTPEMTWENYKYIPNGTFLICETEGTISQIICAQGGWYKTKNSAYARWIYFLDENTFAVHTKIYYDRFATLYEASAIPQILEKEGYKIVGTELRKIEPTFKPFDKVLVRDKNVCRWRCNLFSHFVKNHPFPFRCVGNNYQQCIPYNNETKHLVGNIEMPPKKYIIWE